jgi:broad specificity phosphatase PhoE
MRLLLVRHAESEWNAQRRWQGWSDPPLSEHGRAQAVQAASRVPGTVRSVVSSDLQRARETAQIIASELGLGDVTVDAGWREIDVGAWSGLTMDEVKERHPGTHAQWRGGKLDAYPEGESRAAHRSRLLAAIGRLAAREPDADVMVVTHGGCLSDLERMLDVHPGNPSTNLTARWFRWDSNLSADGERFQLTEAAPPVERAAH